MHIQIMTEAELDKRIEEAKRRQLQAFQEDLADWLKNTLGHLQITSENFIESLGNGVIVCQLAKYIYDKAKEIQTTTDIPELKHKVWLAAGQESFFARENIANFLEFCRALRVNPAILFETEDLVKGSHPRNVTLCLLEVSRIANTVGIDPPGLVKLEEEIEREENLARHSLSQPRLTPLRKTRPLSAHEPLGSGAPRACQSQPVTPKTPRRLNSVPCFRSDHSNSVVSTVPCFRGDRSNSVISTPRNSVPCFRSDRSNSVVSTVPCFRSDRSNSVVSTPRNSVPCFRSDRSNSVVSTPRNSVPCFRSDRSNSVVSTVACFRSTPRPVCPRFTRTNGNTPLTGPRRKKSVESKQSKMIDLHSKVLEVTQSAVFPDTQQIEVERISEGKYMIAGKQVFVRLLKDRHVMVRVGGGWDTLEHFLLRHTANQMECRARFNEVQLLVNSPLQVKL